VAYDQVQTTHSGISYVQVSVHDSSEFLTPSNYEPCADQLEDFKLVTRLKPALYCAHQTELHLSVRQMASWAEKALCFLAFPQKKFVFKMQLQFLKKDG